MAERVSSSHAQLERPCPSRPCWSLPCLHCASRIAFGTPRCTDSVQVSLRWLSMCAASHSRLLYGVYGAVSNARWTDEARTDKAFGCPEPRPLYDSVTLSLLTDGECPLLLETPPPPFPTDTHSIFPNMSLHSPRARGRPSILLTR